MKFRAMKAVSCALLAFSAMPSVFAAQNDPAGAYIASKHNFRQSILSQQSLSSVMQDPATYRGRAVEITGDVLGAVVSGNVHTLLMNVSGTEVSIPVPEKYAIDDWMQPGQKVRMLLSVEGVSAVAGGSPFRLIGAAPEDAVSSAEAVAPAGWMRVSSSSRSVAYVRDPNYGVSRSVQVGVGADALTAGRPVCALSQAALNVYSRYYLAIRQLNPNLTDTAANKITSSVLYFSDQNQVDPRLIIAMIIAESGFDTNATSRTGAMGLGQLMPETARGLGVTDAYDPVQNIGASVRLLRGHLDRYGGAPAHAGVIPFDQIKLVMAAYNAGPGAVSKYHGVPPYRETQNYVRKVAAYYKALCGN
jgi:hypothetical protein